MVWILLLIEPPLFYLLGLTIGYKWGKESKVMKAPEIIYRTTTYLDTDKGKTVWKSHPVAGAENVEYIRKDAFIEKALKFLDEKFYFNNLYHSIESGLFDSEEEMFEDFKNYIK